MGERLMLPRLLAQLADVRLSQGRRAEALDLLREADDLLEGLLTNASSPWVRGRILSSMDDVVSARIRLEGERSGGDPTRLFTVLERSRGRSLVDLLHARPLSDAASRRSSETASAESRHSSCSSCERPAPRTGNDCSTRSSSPKSSWPPLDRVVHTVAANCARAPSVFVMCKPS